MILKSKINNLFAEIRYIKAFSYESQNEKSGMKSFCYQNMEIACEYLLKLETDHFKERLMALINQGNQFISLILNIIDQKRKSSMQTLLQRSFAPDNN